MRKNYQIFLLMMMCNLLILQTSFAQNVAENTFTLMSAFQFQKEFKQMSDFTSLMLQVGDQLDRDDNVDVAIFNDSEKMTNLLQKKMMIYYHFYESSLLIPQDKKDMFKALFVSLKWERIIPLIKKTYLGIDIFFKKKGIGFTLAIMAGVLSKFLIPVILVHLGLAYLIPAFLLLPHAVLYSFIPGYLHKLEIHKMLSKTLGGKVQLQAYLKQQEIMLDALHLHNPDDFIFPITELNGDVKSIIIQRNSWKNNVYQLLGINGESLNVKSMRGFLSENNISDLYIDWVMNNKNIDVDVKTILMTSHILTSKDKLVADRFQQKFSKEIIWLKDKNNWQEIWDWTHKMMKSKTVDEVFMKIDEAPSIMNPKEMSMVWENFLLPEYVKSLDLTYQEARRMFDEFEVLKVKLNTSKSVTVDEKVKNEVFIYLKKILHGKSFQGCLNSNGQINEYLLMKIINL